MYKSRPQIIQQKASRIDQYTKMWINLKPYPHKSWTSQTTFLLGMKSFKYVGMFEDTIKWKFKEQEIE